MKKENILKEKSFQFALRIVRLYIHLKKEHNEYILSKQIVRCGTSIGALVREAEHAESIRDFVHKLNISLKEANETKYWLDLLYGAKFIELATLNSLNKDCEELLRILISSIKTSRNNFNYNNHRN